MSDNEKLREKLKKEIRAVLLPNKNGLTIEEMEQDYLEIMACRLPYRELGYSTLVHLCQDLSDVVEMTRVGRQVVLKGIPDEKTAHVARLVYGQKDSGKPKGLKGAILNMRNGGTWRKRQFYPVNVPQRFERREYNTTKVVVPADIRTRFRELLTSYPNGIIMANINIAYQRRFGTQLDFRKLGFYSLKDMIESMTDTITLQTLREGGCKITAKRLQPANSGRPYESGT